MREEVREMLCVSPGQAEDTVTPKGCDTMITKDMTLADVVKEHPNTIGFLNGLHLDYCCGGHDTIEIAVREKGLDVEKFTYMPTLSRSRNSRSMRCSMTSKPRTM